MIPLILGGIALGGSIIKGAKARKQRKRGEKLQREAEARRTDYRIPQEVIDNQKMARNEAFAEPAIVRYMEEAAQREQANNLSAVNRYSASSADALAAAAGVNATTGQRMADAAITGEQVRHQNMGALYQANNQLADYRTMQWDVNVNMPYLQRMQFAQDMQSAGRAGENQAINDGIGSLMQITSSFGDYYDQEDGGGGGLSNPFQGSQLFMGRAKKRRLGGAIGLPSQVTPKTGNDFRFDSAFE